ncbi:hypothetical protein [Cupriavidus sp. RAF12]|uniref:hypothetical protein n=1 Tax=Cupriavidus sp. RAF12 TaxID=3233050 RepID=UPI003F8D8FF6
MNNVKFNFVAEGDGSGELRLRFEVDKFSGWGRAYFNADELLRQLENFAEFPISSAGAPEIRGGFWDSSAQESRLIQEHLFFSVRPVGTTGQLSFVVRVAVPDGTTGGPVLLSAAAQFPTTYEALGRFVRDMKALLRGESQEAVLQD